MPSQTPEIIIWHNPGCGSSKGALAYLESKGIAPTVYLYMKEKPGLSDLQGILKKLKMKPSDLLRPGEKKGEALGVYGSSDEDAILQAMSENAVLIQRPIVIGPRGAVLARPKARIDDVL
jgi:arsenate reductase (glutaredoxin)